jgi:hypothetical protein
MIMSMEQSVEWELAGETEVLGENLPKCHFVHYHKSHMTWPGLEPGQPATNRLSYDTAFIVCYVHQHKFFGKLGLKLGNGLQI